MNITGPGIYFTIPIFGGINITQTVVSSFVVMVLLCVAGIVLGRKLTKRPGRMQVITEKGVTMIYDLVCDAMGQHNANWAPYIAALFLSSLGGSLISMTGIFRSTTADLSTTATWAIMTSVLVWYHSIKNFGVKQWLKGFTEPVVIMTPMNIISEIAQPISLAFRHFGNIIGGSVITSMVYWALAGASSLLLGAICSNGFVAAAIMLVLGIVLLVVRPQKLKKLCKLLGIVFVAVGIAALLQALEIFGQVPVLQVGIPAILSLYFDLFSGLIQAFVFSLLSMIYISNACPPPEERKQRKKKKVKKTDKAA